MSTRAFTALPSIELIAWAEMRMGHRFPRQPKQKSALAKMFDAGYSADAIREYWERLEKDEFWTGRGFEFGIVLNEIGKSRANSGGRRYTNYENGVRNTYVNGQLIESKKLT